MALVVVAAASLLGCDRRNDLGVVGDPLVDVGDRAGLDFVHFNGMSGEKYVSEVMGPGGALVDFDGDGDLDVYLLQGHMIGPEKSLADALYPPATAEPLVDRLYRNDLVAGDRGRLEVRLTDVTAFSRLEAAGYGMGVAAGDYDRDGDQDLYVTNHGSNELWRNNGDGTFTDVTKESGADDPRWSVSATFLDFDGDGWLDLIVVNYVDFRPGSGRTCRDANGRSEYCGPQTHEPEHDRLLRNRGDGTFADVTLESGIFRAKGSGLGVIVADLDGDGLDDVYVANDLMRNNLWLNQGDGTFRDEGLASGAALNIEGVAEASMGVDAGDIDGDGDLDLFMTHTREQSNTLYLNDGKGLFLDSSVSSRLAEASIGYTGFGTAFLDVDLDGDLDLVSVNGDIKSVPALRDAGDPFPLHQPNQLFVNRGDGIFEEWMPRPRALAISEVSRGVAVGDIDNDGDEDLLITNNAGPARLLANTIDGKARWLGVSLVDRSSGPAIPGSSLVLDRGEVRTFRRARADGSYGSSRDLRVHFGQGPEARGGALTVRGTDGAIVRLNQPPADRYLVIPTGRTIG